MRPSSLAAAACEHSCSCYEYCSVAADIICQTQALHGMEGCELDARCTVSCRHGLRHLFLEYIAVVPTSAFIWASLLVQLVKCSTAIIICQAAGSTVTCIYSRALRRDPDLSTLGGKDLHV